MATAQVVVTVNGKDAMQYAKDQDSKAKSLEVQRFLRDELKAMAKTRRRWN